VTWWNLWLLWHNRRIVITDLYGFAFHVDTSVHGRAGGNDFVTSKMKMPGIEKCVWRAWINAGLDPDEECLCAMIAYHVEAVTTAKAVDAAPPVSGHVNNLDALLLCRCCRALQVSPHAVQVLSPKSGTHTLIRPWKTKPN
jgi:hypothetical protein